MERDMSVTDLGCYCPSALNRVRQRFGEWHRRAQSRDELAEFGDYQLRDIGVSRCSANFSVSKPFWMA